VKFEARHPFAWRGTLLPKTEADDWLAAGFAEYERVIALENACRLEAKGGKLSRTAQDLVDRALFAHESRWQTAARRNGGDTPLLETRADPARREWYDIAMGKGVVLLAALRGHLGAKECDKLFDEFGTAHAGEQVSTDQFLEHCERGAGKPVAELVRSWLGGDTRSEPSEKNIWTIESFEAEPERALIVYGTLRDRAAQREAATSCSAPSLGDSATSRFLFVRTRGQRRRMRSHHLLLIGRPGTNHVAERCVARLPVSFARGSFQVRQETFAHAGSSVIVAGDNPLNPRFSVVAFAGLSAEATWKCVQSLPDEDDEPPAQSFCLPPAESRNGFACCPRPQASRSLELNSR